MKIALIESALNGKGGSQRQALSFAIAFKQLGHDVTVYAIRYDKDACFSDLLDQLTVVSLSADLQPSKIKPMRFLGFLNYMRYAREENRAAQFLAHRIDPETEILNAHDRLGFRVATYYKRSIRNIPSVLMMSDILTKSWMQWRRAQFDGRYKPNVKQRLFNRVIDYYEVRKFIKPHEGMAVLDERTKKWAVDYFHKEAIVVRSGLDITIFPYVAREGIDGRPVRILMAGIFFVHRRYEDVIHAIRLLMDKGYDTKLTIVGNHSSSDEYRAYHKQLRHLVNKLGLEKRVEFPGQISEDELRGHYKGDDIYVSPNHLQSWGLACFEAMASGLPVIVSRTAGASEVLTHNENALLVNPKSPQEIANVIMRLIDDKVLYKKMSMAGRAFVENNMSWERSARAMIHVFEKARATFV